MVALAKGSLLAFVWLPCVAALLPAAPIATGTSGNKFGIGVYDDTPGSPPLEVQLESALPLVGEGGWVLLDLCSWRTTSSSCMNASTTGDPASNSALIAAYARNLTVVARIGYPRYVRDHSDSPAACRTSGTIACTNYTSLAAAYGRLIASLPPPPTGAPLYVTVGNEFNACNEWRCSAPPNVTLTSETMQREVAALAGSVARELQPLRLDGTDTWRPGQLRLAHSAISQWDKTPCQCDTGQALGNPGRPSTVFLQGMLSTEPHLYSSSLVDFLSSHAYPFSDAPVGNAKAENGLKGYRNQTVAVGRNTQFPVVITETGWRLSALQNVTEAMRANWTVLTYQALWLPDQQVIGVCPFLLAGEFWEPMGWPWMHPVDGVRKLFPTPVYSAVRSLRCSLQPTSVGCRRGP